MQVLPTLVAFSLASIIATAAAAANHDDDIAAYFGAASIEERDRAYQALLAASDKGDPQASYAAGVAQFFEAIEQFGTDLARHGFESPSSFMVPLFRLPVPENTAPQPLTYEGFRQIFIDLETRLAAAEARLAPVPDDAEIAIDVDFTVFGIDLNGDSKITPDESLAAIVNAIQPPRGRADELPPSLSFRFDRADGYWLQGYANFLMAATDFWLAHDFELAFDQSFHLFFPAADLPLQNDLVPDFSGTADADIFALEWKLFDFVSLIHLTNWPVAEPERRRDTRRHLLAMIDLSRKNWVAIQAETDNEREWLPGPHQPGANPLTGLEVGADQVTGWHEALDLAEAILNGDRLIPHLRFVGKGINIKRFFDEPTRFDLVMTITGPGALPYIEQGNVVSRQMWRQITRQFGRGGFTTFAIWFN